MLFGIFLRILPGALLAALLAEPALAQQPQAEVDFYAGLDASDNGNYAEAVRLFESACNGGVIEACYNNGFIYSGGAGVPGDWNNAAIFFGKGCDGGHALSCSSLGWLYEEGEGVIQNNSLAISYYSTGCSGDDGYGCNLLGVMYANGTGVIQDYAKAADYFRKAVAAEPDNQKYIDDLSAAEELAQ